jgi:predicted P-loop ATPase
MRAARVNSFNSAAQWLDALAPWDRVDRIAHFYSDVCGAPDTPYVRAVGIYTWLAITSRMRTPGARADMVPVLIGAQGIGKTTLGRIIGGERYGEVGLSNAGDKDWCLALRGKILVEFSELSGHSRAELETIKAVISRTVDEYRAPYERVPEPHPRGFIFFATTNERDFLNDAGGNRRWLPIDCPAPLALDVATAMREQYFAEALAIIRANEAGDYWNVPGAGEVQDEHLARDPWIDLLDEKLRNLAGDLHDKIANSAIYSALGLPADRQTGGGTGRRIAAAMRALGYKRDTWTKPGDRKVRGFTLPTSSDTERAS